MITGETKGEVASARRRLIRGTFAAPAVLALHSGGALAATSLSCVARQVPSDTTVTVIETTPAWLRVQLYALLDGVGNVTQKYWIRGLDLPVVPDQTNFLSGSEYGQFDITTNQLTGVKQIIEPAASGYSWQAASKYVSLRVASGGAILSAGATKVSTQTSAVSYSCWVSFITSP